MVIGQQYFGLFRSKSMVCMNALIMIPIFKMGSLVLGIQMEVILCEDTWNSTITLDLK